MDTTTQMLIGSLVMNALLILKECLARINKSSCCGNEIIFNNPISTRKKQSKEKTQPNNIEMVV